MVWPKDPQRWWRDLSISPVREMGDSSTCRRLREDLLNLYKYRKGGYNEDKDRLFSEDRTGDSGHKLEVLSEHQVTLHCVGNWAMAQFEHKALSTGCPKRLLSRHGPGQAVLAVPAWAVDWTRWPPEVTSNLSHSDSGMDTGWGAALWRRPSWAISWTESSSVPGSREDWQYLLGCRNRATVGKLRGVIILPHSAIIRQHLHPWAVSPSPFQ